MTVSRGAHSLRVGMLYENIRYPTSAPSSSRGAFGFSGIYTSVVNQTDSSTDRAQYVRSTHNSSLRAPLLIDGPGFHGSQQIPELVGLIDVAPTLLEAAGVAVPQSCKGHSVLPLLSDPEARRSWPNRQLIQISESMTGRSLRTADWTYCVADTSGDVKEPAATEYTEYQMYDQRADPSELVNLAGRQEVRAKADELGEQLKAMMVAAGEPEPRIGEAKLYP